MNHQGKQFSKEREAVIMASKVRASQREACDVELSFGARVKSYFRLRL